MPRRKPLPECASGNWSDDETSILMDAWGNAHQRRQPRRLLLEDWRAAASAVNAHRAATGRRFNRTRAQCQTRIRTLKKRYKDELSRQPPSGWPHLSRLRAFLVSPDDSPPGFPVQTRTTPASVKKEVKREAEEAVGGSGLAWSSTVPRRPRLMKLAEVYERVELARIGAEKYKLDMELQQAVLGAVKVKVEEEQKLGNAQCN